MAEVIVRDARPGDEKVLLKFIRDLAEYEKALDQVQATEETLRERFFANNPAVFANVAEIEGEPVGFVIWFLNFSTWLGKHGIYIEDLYVNPEIRGSGIGKQLFEHVKNIAIERDYGRVEWWCLDWNEPAINFYKRMGAEAMVDWTVFRLTGNALGSS